jgi:hypothetical protein
MKSANQNTNQVYCGDCLVLITECGHGYDLRRETQFTKRTIDSKKK